MNAKAIKGKSAGEIKASLEKVMQDDFVITLAIVFISVKQDRKAVVELLREKSIDVFGCTSCGEFINDHHSEGEIVLLLLDADRQHYRILLEDIEDGGIEKAALKIATQAKEHFANPTFLLSSPGIFNDGNYFDGDTLVSTLVKKLGEDCIFFGGMAGDDWGVQNTYIFTHEQESGYGIMALVFDGDKIQLNGMATHGWKPLGIARKVTKSEGNKIYSIDGKPAAAMYFKYLGLDDKIDDENFDVFKEVSTHFPLIGKRDDGESVIISPRSVHKEEGALEVDIPIKQGAEFYFATPPDFEISEQIVSEANAIKNSLEYTPDALLIFSCAGRPPVLGPLTVMENEGVAGVWQVPMAGFYTYGEFGRTNGGRQHFHSGMCCWVTIKEKKKDESKIN